MDAATILKTLAHRETPLPGGPWVMRQTWFDLLFAHWPVAAEVVRPLIPPSLEIDTFERQAWVGVVPFGMQDVRPRGLPAVAGLSSFPELNVRTYVKLNGERGVYFFSLDAGNAIAVLLARAFFHLPYFSASMRSAREGDVIHYRSHRIHPRAPAADYEARYRPIAPVEYAQPGTLAHWLTERYALYTTWGGRVFLGAIHHPQWPLQAAEEETLCDSMALSHAIRLPGTAPLLHFSRSQEVLIWPLRRIDL